MFDQFIDELGVKLTDHQKQMLSEYIRTDKSMKEIGQEFYRSTQGVKTTIYYAKQKMGLEGEKTKSVNEMYIKWLEERLKNGQN